MPKASLWKGILRIGIGVCPEGPIPQGIPLGGTPLEDSLQRSPSDWEKV